MGGERTFSFPFITVGSILLTVTIITLVFHIAVTVTMLGTPRAVAISSAVAIVVSVAVATLFFPRGIVTSTTSRRG